MRTIETKVYSLNELSEEAQGKAFNNWLELSINDDFWQEYVLGSFTDILKRFGVHEPMIYYRGFWSQGDGACFIGLYTYQKGWKKDILPEYPYLKDSDIIKAMENIQTIQAQYFYDISATISHTGHYYHEYSTSFDFCSYTTDREILERHEDALKDYFRDIMQEIYSALEKEYRDTHSMSYFKEEALNNGYEYTSNGVLI